MSQMRHAKLVLIGLQAPIGLESDKLGMETRFCMGSVDDEDDNRALITT